MSLKDIKLISFDIDRTLLDPAEGPYALTDEISNAVQRLRDMGRFTLILNSGREPWVIEPLAQRLKIPNYCAFSGRFAIIDDKPWMHPQAEIHHSLLQKISSLVKASKASHAELKGTKNAYLLQREEGVPKEKIAQYKPPGWFSEQTFIPIKIEDFNDTCLRLELSIESSHQPKLFAALDNFKGEVVNSLIAKHLPQLVEKDHDWLGNGAARAQGVWYLRLVRTSIRCNKASILAYLAKELSLSPKEILHIGDSSRDIDGDLIAKTALGTYFATVANGDKNALAGADLILPPVKEHSIAALLPFFS